jgi:hypothetical protein
LAVIWLGWWKVGGGALRVLPDEMVRDLLQEKAIRRDGTVAERDKVGDGGEGSFARWKKKLGI